MPDVHDRASAPVLEQNRSVRIPGRCIENGGDEPVKAPSIRGRTPLDPGGQTVDGAAGRLRTVGRSGVPGNFPGSSGLASRVRRSDCCFPTCEPTTHRAVWRVFLPPPHHLHECRPEPTHATPNGGGSRLHRALEASPGSRARPRLSGSAARLSQPICEVFRVPMGTDPRTQPAEEREQTSAQAPSTAITSATNLHDAVSVRCDESCTMRCRKKLYDALSVRSHR